MKKILLTGGTGYIGSHTAVELINNNYEVVLLDNLSNSSINVLDKIEAITGVKPKFYEMNLQSDEVETVFKENEIEAVIHFAGLKAVGESVKRPLDYYENNIDSSLNLLRLMQKHGVNKLIFSSSATVYGTATPPHSEDSQIGIGITNPYGWTKFMIEQIIRDFSVANKDFEATVLRYYNPVGAHESGLIGEDPKGIPNNLLPYVLKVAHGELDQVTVYGDDYETPDGTGVRDYIHVVDLAKGHVAALEKINSGFEIYNLGTGKGTSVLEIINYVKKACGHEIKFEIGPRRPGDLDSVYANPAKAEKELGWTADKTAKQACKDSWNWVK